MDSPRRVRHCAHNYRYHTHTSTYQLRDRVGRIGADCLSDGRGV